ncbi:MAG TPA: hypothetical protein PKD93_08455, partial [Ferruginibacter sp.]|nr:hypothetical protein [Ferruginibacter sp.]
MQKKRISQPVSILNNPIEYIQGVTALKADLLKKELGIFRFQDLLEHYPLRHLDKTRLDKIGQLNASSSRASVIRAEGVPAASNLPRSSIAIRSAYRAARFRSCRTV